MNWLTDIVRPKIKKTTPKEISDDLWVKCPECGQMLFSKELKQSMYVCTKCGHHLRLYVDKRLKQLFDDGIYTEMALPTVKEDPLKFKDTQKYVDRLKVYRKKTGNNDAIKVGPAKSAELMRLLRQWISRLWAVRWERPWAKESLRRRNMRMNMTAR